VSPQRRGWYNVGASPFLCRNWLFVSNFRAIHGLEGGRSSEYGGCCHMSLELSSQLSSHYLCYFSMIYRRCCRSRRWWGRAWATRPRMRVTSAFGFDKVVRMGSGRMGTYPFPCITTFGAPVPYSAIKLVCLSRVKWWPFKPGGFGGLMLSFTLGVRVVLLPTRCWLSLLSRCWRNSRRRLSIGAEQCYNLGICIGVKLPTLA